jgi:hypothetical protein
MKERKEEVAMKNEDEKRERKMQEWSLMVFVVVVEVVNLRTSKETK